MVDPEEHAFECGDAANTHATAPTVPLLTLILFPWSTVHI